MTYSSFHWTRLLILFPALLAGCDTQDQVPDSIVRNRTALSAATQLTCLYRKWHPQGATAGTLWHFQRSADRTESFDEYSGQGERWIHDPSGAIFYYRIFFAQKAVLESHPGDLAAAGAKVSWDHLYSIIDPELLQPGDRQAVSSPAGTEHYVRTLADGTREDIVWMPDLKLPLRVSHTASDARGHDELRLLGCSDAQLPTFRPVTEEEFAAFRTVEFSDLGDMESDPLVQQLAPLLGGHHH